MLEKLYINITSFIIYIMTLNDDQFVGVMNTIIERQLRALKDMAGEDQSFDDVQEKLTTVTKKEVRRTLENLWTLYDEYLDTDECTIATLLEYIPWMIVYGLMLGAQVGVTQDEAYMMVDYYLVRNNLVKD